MRASGGWQRLSTGVTAVGRVCKALLRGCSVHAAGLRIGATFRTSTAACTCWIPLSLFSRTSAQPSSRYHSAILNMDYYTCPTVCWPLYVFIHTVPSLLSCRARCSTLGHTTYEWGARWLPACHRGHLFAFQNLNLPLQSAMPSTVLCDWGSSLHKRLFGALNRRCAGPEGGVWLRSGQLLRCGHLQRDEASHRRSLLPHQCHHCHIPGPPPSLTTFYHLHS